MAAVTVVVVAIAVMRSDGSGPSGELELVVDDATSDHEEPDGVRLSADGLDRAADAVERATSGLGWCDVPGIARSCAGALARQQSAELAARLAELRDEARDAVAAAEAAAEADAAEAAAAEAAAADDAADDGGADAGGSSGGSTSAPAPSASRRGTDGGVSIPTEAQLKDVSRPDQVIGTGTPASCTSAAVVDAVARGGVIVFDCGPDPVTIAMDATAKVVNDRGPEIVIDGGGLVTLDGRGARRILYMNTCDQAQTWTTATCNDQDHPRLTVQNLSFQNANVGGTDQTAGGAAIFARGGQLTVINSLFRDNRCNDTGPDVGGAAIRAFDQYQGRPLHVVHSTFERNRCSNGGAISSIGVSWTITNSVFRDNRAVGTGANPARAGTPGGGNGGAIALDGNRFTLRLRGSSVTDNHANEGGGGIFFVSNDRSGHLVIEGSTLQRNVSAGFETDGVPGIFYLGDGAPQVSGSTLAR